MGRPTSLGVHREGCSHQVKQGDVPLARMHDVRSAVRAVLDGAERGDCVAHRRRDRASVADRVAEHVGSCGVRSRLLVRGNPVLPAGSVSALGGTRIPNLLIRSQMLYPIELRALDSAPDLGFLSQDWLGSTSTPLGGVRSSYRDRQYSGAGSPCRQLASASRGDQPISQEDSLLSQGLFGVHSLPGAIGNQSSVEARLSTT